ncbi:14 kDa proline-rich protein DC2.15-like [Syzygium oleosum]|uniref:14 kDa proline-rich protein DC2.15-like n=1 Tax=Syzygium oleosum TaxID=219896 RepID=UPI0011D21AEB|nr:14 kDa proline-rich protein DC2.15-like [Syzygium oleosum]
MAHSTPIFILSLLLLATISNACRTCMLPSPPPPKPPCPPPPPPPKPPCPPPPAAACPKDTWKLGVCRDLLGGVMGGIIGTPTSSPCCALLKGWANLEVVECLCAAIKANWLGMHLNISIAWSTIISTCGTSVPPGYKCE